jgi:hypothetical protein
MKGISMNTLIQLKKTIPLLFAAFTLLYFSPVAQGVKPSPTPTPTGASSEDRGNHNSAAEGVNALNPGTTGANNTAHGWSSLLSNTTGDDNTATGLNALVSNTQGSYNTANGVGALGSNTTGDYNTAVGWHALPNNAENTGNVAIGEEALRDSLTGWFNTAVGSFAMQSAAPGDNNTAIGVGTLFETTGTGNTAVGGSAMSLAGSGSLNTAIGEEALGAVSTGNFNIAVGYLAGFDLTTGDNNIDIGHRGVAGEANTIRIGTNGTQTATFIAGINGATASDGTAVFIDVNGQLGTVTSSARFKDNIKPMDNASEVLFSLKPVSFRYTKAIDPIGKSQFGLVAEDVEKVNPDLIVRDKGGKPYSVRYEQVNAMLLNEFLKEHRKVQELEADNARQQKQIDALTAGLQKVSAQLEVSKAAPQTVVNNR